MSDVVAFGVGMLAGGCVLVVAAMFRGIYHDLRAALDRLELDATMTPGPWYYREAPPDAAGIAALRNALPLLAETLEAAAALVALSAPGEVMTAEWWRRYDKARAAIERCREEGLL